MIAGRWEQAKQPNEQELKATSVLSLPLEEVSAKVRTGPPIDDDEDYALPVWGGVVPVIQTLRRTRAGRPGVGRHRGAELGVSTRMWGGRPRPRRTPSSARSN